MLFNYASGLQEVNKEKVSMNYMEVATKLLEGEYDKK